MIKILFTLSLIVGLSGNGFSQHGYIVSGKIRGLNTEKVYLVSADQGAADTLASASVTSEGFVLTGNLPGGIRAVNLVLSGVDGQLPILLENMQYQVSVTQQGAIVEGEGPAAKLLKEFEGISRDYAAEQNCIQAELQAAGNTSDAQTQSFQLRADNAYKESVRRMHELLRTHADSYVSAYVIALGMAADDEATLRAKYELLTPAARATAPGKAIAAALDRYGELAVGGTAPDFTLSKPDGNTFALHGLPAKWKLVHFWASSNPASRQQNPELVRLYLQYRPKGFEIVSVSLDTDRAAWKNAVGLDGLIWTNGSDLKGPDASEPARLYLVGDLPAFFLLDAENRIVARDLSLSDLRAKLAELTKRKKK